MRDAEHQARTLIDAVHARDPVRDADGRAAELVYADRMEAWLARLVPSAPVHMVLAARCQHLERWSVPRASYPAGRAGYLSWRKKLYGTQAERARELMLQAGWPDAEADEVGRWVAKRGIGKDPGTQALEDAACLVFLENELAAFAAQHAEYPREKFIEIVGKTWRKMSASARGFGATLSFAAEIRAVVREACGIDS